EWQRVEQAAEEPARLPARVDVDGIGAPRGLRHAALRRRHHVAADVSQLVILEIQDDVALLPAVAALGESEDVIPAILVEGILDGRRAHDEAHLLLVHAGLQAIQHFLLDDVSLLDVDAVNAGKLARAFGAARGKAEHARGQQHALACAAQPVKPGCPGTEFHGLGPRGALSESIGYTLAEADWPILPAWASP